MKAASHSRHFPSLKARWLCRLAPAWVLLVVLMLLSLTVEAWAAELGQSVRGLATRAPAGMRIDGQLTEWNGAFATPVEYFHGNLTNRAAQFFYMWDENAFYAGLRTLDQFPANHAADDQLWDGDAVEWYFDTRRHQEFRGTLPGTKWGPGAVHCSWTGLNGTNVQPRFCLRPGSLGAIPKVGIEVGARRMPWGMEVEFKLPWANFPDFVTRGANVANGAQGATGPKAGEVIGLEAELCYSDGGGQVFRTSAFGSPHPESQPGSLARVQLVEKFERAFWKACAPVLMPIRCDTGWTPQAEANVTDVTGLMALPPSLAGDVGRLFFRLVDLNGRMIDEFPGTVQTFSSAPGFRRALATWPADTARPGLHHLVGIIYDPAGQELARVAPSPILFRPAGL